MFLVDVYLSPRRVEKFASLVWRLSQQSANHIVHTVFKIHQVERAAQLCISLPPTSIGLCEVVGLEDSPF